MSVRNKANNRSIFIESFKRTEKLCAAVYLVTDTIDEHDLLRQQIRSSALRILSFMASGVQSEEGIFVRSFLDKLPKHLVELLAFLDVAHLSGLVSDMNYHILAQEIESMVSLCSETLLDLPVKEKYESVRAPQQWNVLAEDKVHPLPAGKHKGQKGHHKRTHSYIRQNENQSSLPGVASVNQGADSSGGERTTLVLGFFKDGSSKSIKDISQSLNGYSEKTVQRILASLVRSGVLKREGERRWSRYSLAFPEKNEPTKQI